MSLSTSEVVGLQISKYFNVAGMAILIFDYVITLEDEARWVWGRNWNATRYIFTVSRYLPFVGVGMTAYAALRSASQRCPPSFEENLAHKVGVIAAELLLVMRTYAFWQGDKRVLYSLLAYGTVLTAAVVALDVSPIHLSYVPPGCLLIASRNSIFVYVFLMMFETVMLLLTAYKQFHTYRNVRAKLVRTIYLESVFYMLCIILITFANLVIHGILPLQLSELLDTPQVTLHSVLASRILFNLRKRADESGTMNLPTITDINV